MLIIFQCLGRWKLHWGQRAGGQNSNVVRNCLFADFVAPEWRITMRLKIGTNSKTTARRLSIMIYSEIKRRVTIRAWKEWLSLLIQTLLKRLATLTRSAFRGIASILTAGLTNLTTRYRKNLRKRQHKPWTLCMYSNLQRMWTIVWALSLAISWPLFGEERKPIPKIRTIISSPHSIKSLSIAPRGQSVVAVFDKSVAAYSRSGKILFEYKRDHTENSNGVVLFNGATVSNTGLCVVRTPQNAVYVLSSAGKLLWTLPVFCLSKYPISPTDEVIFLPSTSNEICAYELATGKFLWQIDPELGVLESLEVSPRGLLVAKASRGLARIEEGKIKWRHLEAPVVNDPMFAFSTSTVFTERSSSQLCCLDSSGSVLWRQKDNGFCDAASIGDTLMTIIMSNGVQAKNIQTGTTVWNYPLQSVRHRETIVNTLENRSIILDGPDRLLILDENGKESHVIRSSNLRYKSISMGNDNRVYVLASEVNGRLFVGSVVNELTFQYQ